SCTPRQLPFSSVEFRSATTYRWRRFSASLAFSLSEAESANDSPVFGSFSDSNGILQLALMSESFAAAMVAVVSALAADVTITSAMAPKNSEARILPPSTHSLITKACQVRRRERQATAPKQVWNAGVSDGR